MLKGAPAICYPTASATACSWDPEMIYQMGQALGDECRKEGKFLCCWGQV